MSPRPTGPLRPSRHPGRAGTVALVVLGAAGATVVAPGAFGLAGTVGWTQAVAVRGLVGAAAAAAGLVGALGLVGLRRRPESAARTALAGATTVCLAVAVTQGGVLVARGTVGDPLPAPGATGELTVVAANTLGGSADPVALADLLVQVGADVVSLPETDARAARLVTAELARRGVAVQSFTAPAAPPVSPTTLLVADRLGPHRVVASPDGGPGAVVVAPADRAGPLLAAVHPFPPLGLASTATWRTRSRQAADVCRSAADAVVAGDFNATVDHPALAHLGPCRDAAAERGASAGGTWPQRLPAALGAPLDHVLATAATWRVTSFSTAPLPGSDHRAVVARLVRR